MNDALVSVLRKESKIYRRKIKRELGACDFQADVKGRSGAPEAGLEGG